MIKNRSLYVTCPEAATMLGFSQEHIRQLLQRGKIKGEKIGTNWVIKQSELKNIKRQRFKREKESVNGTS